MDFVVRNQERTGTSNGERVISNSIVCIICLYRYLFRVWKTRQKSFDPIDRTQVLVFRFNYVMLKNRKTHFNEL